MRFASIGSGSDGNGLVVEKNTTRLLLDCGFGLRDTLTRLERLKLQPEELSGILITHEHEDHASGAYKLANKYNIPVWLTHGTHKMIERLLPKHHQASLEFFKLGIGEALQQRGELFFHNRSSSIPRT